MSGITTKRGTFEVLNDRFMDVDALQVDENYLNSELQSHLMSDEALYERIKGNKDINAIVKDALVLIANILLNTKYFESHHATRKQVSDWITECCRGDVSILPTVEYVKQERFTLRNS